MRVYQRRCVEATVATGRHPTTPRLAEAAPPAPSPVLPECTHPREGIHRRMPLAFVISLSFPDQCPLHFPRPWVSLKSFVTFDTYTDNTWSGCRIRNINENVIFRLPLISPEIRVPGFTLGKQRRVTHIPSSGPPGLQLHRHGPHNRAGTGSAGGDEAHRGGQ